MRAGNGGKSDRTMCVNQDLGLGFFAGFFSRRFFGNRSSRSFFGRAAFGSLFSHRGCVISSRVGGSLFGHRFGNGFGGRYALHRTGRIRFRSDGSGSFFSSRRFFGGHFGSGFFDDFGFGCRSGGNAERGTVRTVPRSASAPLRSVISAKVATAP